MSGKSLSRGLRPAHLAAAVGALALLWSGPAWGQACCSATGAASDVAAVGRCRTASAVAQLSYLGGMGSFDSRGDYQPLSDAQIHDLILIAGGGFRFSALFSNGRDWARRVQVYGAVPIHTQHRDMPGHTPRTGNGLGDVTMASRVLVLEDGMQGIGHGESLAPFLDLIGAVKLPTGRAPDQSDDPMGADVTGDGAWELSGGARLTKFVTPSHAIGLRFTYAHRFPRETLEMDQTRRFARGDQVDVQVNWVQVHTLRLFWGAFVDWRHSGLAREADGAAGPWEQIADSDETRLRIGAHISYAIKYPYYTMTLGVSSDAPLSGVGKNIPFAGPSVAVSLNRAFF